jgi:hypothetical protein
VTPGFLLEHAQREAGFPGIGQTSASMPDSASNSR